MGRVYNFSAGPAVLPEEVLREAAAEMLDYQGTGMSVMEMSHRSAAFKGIIEEAEADLRDPRQLQGAVLAGWCNSAVCRHPHEPDAERQGRLRRFWFVV